MAAASFASREELKKARDLEEARKAGTIPAERDEEGKEINPHIPQYISKAPWYLNQSHPGLKHQRQQAKTPGEISDIKKGLIQGSVTTKFRKGACTNCGAMTHNAKACVERPRKIGAKFTGQDFKPDEYIVVPERDFDGKRDRWAGYDTSEYTKVISRWQDVEEERKLKKAEDFERTAHDNGTESAKKKKKPKKDGDSDSDSDSDAESSADEEFAERDTANNAPVAGYDPRTKTTIRNLRIREDTAKYLLNLDLNSAHYDPKSRSMRENPLPHLKPDEQVFKGDNYVKFSGEVKDMGELQLFAWDAEHKGEAVDPLALPSQAELMFKQFREKKDSLKSVQRQQLLSKYGGEEHLEQPEEIKFAQTESYVEYARDGRVLRGLERAAVRSKYEEDIYPQNHKSVWGSYWREGRWGFACCHQFVRNSYCTGEAGKQAAESITAMTVDSLNNNTTGKSDESVHWQAEEDAKRKKQESSLKKDATPWGHDLETAEIDPKKLKKALKREEHRKQHAEEADERKRKFNSLSSGSTDVTAEEMEAYRLKRSHMEDPMRNMNP